MNPNSDIKEINENSSDESSVDGHQKGFKRIKLIAGETREQAIERLAKEKEVKRLQKLMRYAYPRQREEHVYKKKLLPEKDHNASVDLVALKKESKR